MNAGSNKVILLAVGLALFPQTLYRNKQYNHIVMHVLFIIYVITIVKMVLTDGNFLNARTCIYICQIIIRQRIVRSSLDKIL